MSHRDRIEGRRLQQHALRVLGDLRGGASHDAGDGQRLFAVRDQKVLGSEATLLAIQGRQGLPVPCPAHDNASTRELVEVERMGRLAQVQHEIVGEVHQEPDGSHADIEKTALHPVGRTGTGRDVLDHPGQIARTTLEIVDLYGDVLAHGGQALVHLVRTEFPAEDGRKLAGEAVVTPQVGPVGDGLVVDVEQHVVQIEQLDQGLADLRVLVEDQDTLVALPEPQLALRADHAVGDHPADLAGFQAQASWQHGAHPGVGDLLSGVHVGSTADDVELVLARVHPTQAQAICIRMRAPFEHVAHVDVAKFLAGAHQLLDEGALHGQFLGDLLGREAGEIDVIAEPFHAELHRSLAGSELAEEAQVPGHQVTDVGDAVLHHGQTVDAHAKGKAAVALGVDVPGFQDPGVDHAAAAQFDPAGLLAHRATVAGADQALEIQLQTGLDEGEVEGAQAADHFTPEDLAEDGLQHALEVAD